MLYNVPIRNPYSDDHEVLCMVGKNNKDDKATLRFKHVRDSSVRVEDFQNVLKDAVDELDRKVETNDKSVK